MVESIPRQPARRTKQTQQAEEKRRYADDAGQGEEEGQK